MANKSLNKCMESGVEPVLLLSCEAAKVAIKSPGFARMWASPSPSKIPSDSRKDGRYIVEELLRGSVKGGTSGLVVPRAINNHT